MMKQHHEQAFVRPERTTPRKAYEAALADFRPGATWAGLEAKQGKPTFVFWGKAAGMSADEIIADVHAAGVRNRDADIRRAWKTAHPQGDRPQASWTRTLATKPNPPPTFPHYVRDMVASGGNEATSADLLALSPFAVPKDARAQTVAFLRSMFDPADNLYIFRDDVPSTGKIGTNLMPCCDWLATIEGGDNLVKWGVARRHHRRKGYVIAWTGGFPCPRRHGFWIEIQKRLMLAVVESADARQARARSRSHRLFVCPESGVGVGGE